MTANNNGSLIHSYLRLMRQHGAQAMERKLQQIGNRTNEARRAVIAPPVSWELLCEIVPETFDE